SRSILTEAPPAAPQRTRRARVYGGSRSSRARDTRAPKRPLSNRGPRPRTITSTLDQGTHPARDARTVNPRAPEPWGGRGRRAGNVPDAGRPRTRKPPRAHLPSTPTGGCPRLDGGRLRLAWPPRRANGPSREGNPLS